MRFGIVLGKAFAAMLLTLILADLVVRSALPHSIRLSDNFSAAYLQRAIHDDNLAQKAVVAGDSALWGYGLMPDQSAVSRLKNGGVALENLSFEGGSTVNTYALLRLLQVENIHPKAVLFNINLKEFNAADSAYRTLYPGVEQLVWDHLTSGERGLLIRTRTPSFDAKVDAALSAFWPLYGMRSDIREQLFGTPDAITAVRNALERMSGESARVQATHAPVAARFMGTYDLSPLSSGNVEVIFLRKIIALLNEQRIPSVAVLTPTNHGLLHDYIDAPEYDSQLAYIRSLLSRNGIRVLDYDRAFRPTEFFDNDHLTSAGNKHLGVRLRHDLHL